MRRRILCSLTLALCCLSPRAAPRPGEDISIPVTVTGRVTGEVVAEGEAIPLVVTVTNGLAGVVGYSTHSLTPNEWNGETQALTLVDVTRDGKPELLFLERPAVIVPRKVAGLTGHRIEAGKSLTLRTDARKWKIVGGWTPGKYEVDVRVERMSVDEGRCVLSVHSAPFRFEIR